LSSISLTASFCSPQLVLLPATHFRRRCASSLDPTSETLDEGLFRDTATLTHALEGVGDEESNVKGLLKVESRVAMAGVLQRREGKKEDERCTKVGEGQQEKGKGGWVQHALETYDEMGRMKH
jgi:hypothetical protein